MSTLAYPKYKDSGVEWLGQVPEHWEVKRLKHLTTCLDGQRIPLNSEQRHDMQGDYPYWGANNVVDFLDQYLFDEELVLLGEDGAPFFDPTKPVAFHITGKVWINNHIHVLRPGSDVDSHFLTHVLNCVAYGKFIHGSTRDKLTQGDMREIPIQFPPLPEQRAIASYLDRETARLDTLIARQERMIELSLEKRRALISHAVTRGLDETAPLKESGVEWLGQVPAHWGVLSLKRLCSFAYGDSLAEDNRQEGNIPVFGSNGIVGNHSEANTQAPCIIVGRKGSFGKVTYSEQAGFAIDTTYFVDASQTQQDLRWMFYLLASLNLGDVSQDTGVPGLSRENAYSRKVVFPPLPEQRAIVAYLDAETVKIDTLIEKARRAIELMKEHRSALIAAAVTGQIDVRGV